ncbi:MAG: FAD-dependent oxidoreductase [Myxococcales bacterium]|nr:FAD-dependent oxidoreductase [Myxococcales bacterium]
MKSFGTIAVVGTSLAGLRAIEALRREGYPGRICAIGEEPCMPYDRPPLSKQFLKGDWDADKIVLHHELADDEGIEWMLARRVTALDPGARRLVFEAGDTLDYDGLIIATGARARKFPNAPDLEGIFVLRTLADAEALRHALESKPRVAVIGAGFIGMEVAASCRERGLEVTVVEFLDTPLVRGLGCVLGEHVAGVFRERGVEVRCGVGVKGFVGKERVEALELEDGTRVEAEVVVVGIGATPATEWLEGSGLALDNGVLCDEFCAAAAPDVVVAGDVARWRDPRTGLATRVEHWTNAVEQSVHAARRLLLGEEVGPFEHVPYVWTDQFDLRIQIAGEVREGDKMRVGLGSLEAGRCLVLFGREGKLTGAVGFKRARQVNEFRDLIGQGIGWDAAVARLDG